MKIASLLRFNTENQREGKSSIKQYFEELRNASRVSFLNYQSMKLYTLVERIKYWGCRSLLYPLRLSTRRNIFESQNHALSNRWGGKSWTLFTSSQIIWLAWKTYKYPIQSRCKLHLFQVSTDQTDRTNGKAIFSRSNTLIHLGSRVTNLLSHDGAMSLLDVKADSRSLSNLLSCH